MNLARLKQAEQAFLHRYPGGFENLDIVAIRKEKHNVDKMIAFTQEAFSKRNFKFPEQIIQNMINSPISQLGHLEYDALWVVSIAPDGKGTALKLRYGSGPK